MAGDRVLVTGASGFVGSAVARTLLRAGFFVSVLLRPASNRINIDNLDVEVVEGDMRDVDAVAHAMRGVRYLFHVAADYRLWAQDPEEIVRTNCEGTRTLMCAALTAGAEKIVYTSSVATLEIPANGDVADETMPLSAAAAIGAYKRSKVMAEALVEQMIAEDQLPAVIVHPSTPIGPRDVKPTPTGRIIVEAASGRMPAYVDTGLNFVHVDDVAAGHLAALRRGAIGGHYILGGQNVRLASLLADIAELSGRRPPRFRIPRTILYPLAVAAETKARLTNREPFLTLDGLRMSKYCMFFTSAKAQRDLGYETRPYREALADALEWFRANRYLQ
ncbi:MAG: hopanoid-associated sugar epimerase [Beijerinckiaceae bacterium]